MIEYLTLCRLAERRHNLHEQHGSSRPLSQDYELVGLLGEFEFSRLFNLPIDTDERPAGDNGIDFVVSEVEIDVKTARIPNHLLVEVGKVKADVYVLAGVDNALTRAYLLGWAGRNDVLKAPERDWGYGIVSHSIPASDLRTMPELARRLAQ